MSSFSPFQHHLNSFFNGHEHLLILTGELKVICKAFNLNKQETEFINVTYSAKLRVQCSLKTVQMCCDIIIVVIWMKKGREGKLYI